MVSGYDDHLPDGWSTPVDVDLFPSGSDDQWTAEAIYPDESFSVTADSPGEAIEGLYDLIAGTDTL